MEFLILLIFHFIADFIFQSHQQAINKSSSLKSLTDHVYIYSLIMTLGFIIAVKPSPAWYALMFAFITFIAHFLTDALTSRWVKSKRLREEYGSTIPNFGMFTIIGFDQLLHYLQLYFTLHLLS